MGLLGLVLDHGRDFGPQHCLAASGSWFVALVHEAPRLPTVVVLHDLHDPLSFARGAEQEEVVQLLSVAPLDPLSPDEEILVDGVLVAPQVLQDLTHSRSDGLAVRLYFVSPRREAGRSAMRVFLREHLFRVHELRATAVGLAVDVLHLRLERLDPCRRQLKLLPCLRGKLL